MAHGADDSSLPVYLAVPFKLSLPASLEERLAGLGSAIADAAPDVDFAYLFGSTVEGRRTTRSDVDLAIHLAGNADSHRVRLDIARAAAKHLGTDAIDVVVLNSAPLSLAGRVLTSRRVVLDRAPFARHRYESLTARMFQDFRLREHRLLTQRYPHG